MCVCCLSWLLEWIKRRSVSGAMPTLLVKRDNLERDLHMYFILELHQHRCQHLHSVKQQSIWRWVHMGAVVISLETNKIQGPLPAYTLQNDAVRGEECLTSYPAVLDRMNYRGTWDGKLRCEDGQKVRMGDQIPRLEDRCGSPPYARLGRSLEMQRAERPRVRMGYAYGPMAKQAGKQACPWARALIKVYSGQLASNIQGAWRDGS